MNSGFGIGELQRDHACGGLEIDRVNPVSLEPAVVIQGAASPRAGDDRDSVIVLVNVGAPAGTRFSASEAGKRYYIVASGNGDSRHAASVAVPSSAWTGIRRGSTSWSGIRSLSGSGKACT